MRIAAIALLLWLLPAWALAQGAQPATLIADRLEIEGDRRLIASGNVEALYGETRLKARSITYDRAADRLILEGPVILQEGTRIVLLAEGGALDPRLENGLLRGARLVLDQQVQLAARQVDRIGGRYTQLYKVAATSCRVCDDGRPPLWQIRASRAIHDTEARQLYFDNAQIRVLDVPILWVPRLRLPDPTLERATGFLLPSARQSSQLGLGVRLPYFIRLGDHRDLTLTPYLAQNSRTLEWRYRQAFRRGDISIDGALSQDNLRPGLRGYVFGQGRFDLPDGYRLSFDLKSVTDRAYLLDYGYSSRDRLESEIALTRSRDSTLFRAGLIGYQSLRDDERRAEVPTLIGDIRYTQVFTPARIGGRVTLDLDLHGHRRTATADVLGRDVARAGLDLGWRRDWVLQGGILAEVEAGLALDRFAIFQDSLSPGRANAATPRAAVTLRYPMARQTARGATQMIEPVLMAAMIGGRDPGVPNDESTRVEFDEGNLLALSRFPAPDRRERGAMVVYGINWQHLAPSGARLGLSLGQVLRSRDAPDFTASSGLGGRASDVLLAGQWHSAGGLTLTARGLLNDQLDLAKAEARADLARADMGLAASYVWLRRDLAEARPDTVAEIALDGRYRVSRHWTTTGNWRYDLAADRTAIAGVGLEYRNECVDLRLSLSRRFTSSTIVKPATDFGFTVGLRGFSAQTQDQSYTRQCRN